MSTHAPHTAARSRPDRGAGTAPAIVHETLAQPGRRLDPSLRDVAEARLGHDFGDVRIHTDERAAASARAIDASAYTVRNHVVLGSPSASLRLLAHELAHVVQQSGSARAARPIEVGRADGALEQEAEAAGNAAVAGAGARVSRAAAGPGPLAQRQFAQPSPSVRLPVAEELVTQLSTVEADVHGRPLTGGERELAQSVFGTSIDFTRVRLIPGQILNYRTVGNTIRVPSDFTITNEYMAQTFIHELTHVWQYQHGGTSYISISLGTQIVATIETGSRNAAYDYRLTPHSSFFDFRPEQQALIVENYFAMLRDRTKTMRDGPFQSAHIDGQGNFTWLSYPERQAEITRELPLHEPLIRQLRTAVPRTEADVLMLRASEVMRVPGQDILPVPPERQLTPVRPLLEVRFGGL